MIPIEALDEENFFSLVDASGDCWTWTNALSTNGYAYFHINKKTYLAHRVSYQMFHGEITAGLDIDHLCRNRGCVNPHHLEAVSRSINLRRGIGPTLAKERYAKITHCKRGHEYTPENTKRKRGARICISCQRTLDSESQRKRRTQRRENATKHNHIEIK